MGIYSGRVGAIKAGDAPLGRVRPTHLVHWRRNSIFDEGKQRKVIALPNEEGRDKAEQLATFRNNFVVPAAYWGSFSLDWWAKRYDAEARKI
jgi:hypothetical protein